MLDQIKTSPDVYPHLSREILTSLRGKESQAAFSAKLGFQFNQVGKWESGATIFRWQDFTSVCDILNIPWVQNFNSTFCFHTGMDINDKAVFSILSQFFGFASTQEMTHFFNKSRSSVSRLLQPNASVDFADVLQIMDMKPFVLGSWLSKFLNLNDIEVLQEKFASESLVYSVLCEMPWTTLVNACLHLQKFKSSDLAAHALIAAKTGLTLDQVLQALDKLILSGVVETQDGFYKSHIRDMTFMRNVNYRKVTRFFLSQIVNSFQITAREANLQNPSLTGSRVCALSSQASQKLADLMVRFHHEVGEIVKNDTHPKDHVRMVVFNSLDASLLVANSDQDRPNLETT